MHQHIHVVFAANRPYVPYLSAALTSVRHNLNRQVSLHATVLSRDLVPEEIRWPNQQHGDALRCVEPTIPDDVTLPIRSTDHVSVETYYRLFLASVFDASVTRVIYLDSDLIVLGDLANLHALNLEGKTIAAALDIHVRNWSHSRCLAGLQAENTPYFNAGVLVIDLAAWRSRGVTERSITFLKEARERVRFWDQDALNYALRGDWLELDPRWNRMTHYWEQLATGSLPFPPDVVARLADAYIVHFASGRKPWQGYSHPDRRVFNRYVAMAGFPERRMTLYKAVKRRVARFWGASPTSG